MPERQAEAGAGRLPSVDELLRAPRLAPLWEELGPAWARAVIRETLEARRRRWREEDAAGAGDLDAELRAGAAARLAWSLRPAINATGIILHTNLGRAPLSREAAGRLAELAAGYSNLELDLDTGHRGRRDVHAEALACALTGAERTLVVNNNAAAVLLVVNTLAAGAPDQPAGEVLVSRGELVEIGGSFRIPEVLARGGAKLAEVGATNRTRLADYRRAITAQTRLILRVHRSNFQMRGFTAQPTLAELCALGRETGIPVAEDLGSGCLVDLSPAGLAREPLVGESLAAGVDAVTYSGDKLLGGPQAGLISGRRALLDRLRANPLFRALRVDRLTYAALEATLRAYGRGQRDQIPALRMIFMPEAEIAARARQWAAAVHPAWRAEVVRAESVVGGGATPGQTLPTWALALTPAGETADALEARLRAQIPPVVARIHQGRVLLDPRTVLPEQESALLAVLAALAAS
ncbi:MAG: L-seryl-tRNA(Sec) selenium transferase [Terriglobales bacterium]